VQLFLEGRDRSLVGIEVRESWLSARLDRWPERLGRCCRSAGEMLDVCGGDICLVCIWSRLGVQVN